MFYPPFFDEAPKLTLRDPLADFLGAAENGIMTYGYLDAVKLAGHSCPTVAGAYIMTLRALEELYPGEVPIRGEVAVKLGDQQGDGAAGVVAAVAGLLTGAAGPGGFGGIAGRHSRRHLLDFGSGSPGAVLFRRLDRMQGVTATVNMSAMPVDQHLPTLMRKVLDGTATAAEAQDFRWAWQDRVRRILLEPDAYGIVTLREARRAA